MQFRETLQFIVGNKRKTHCMLSAKMQRFIKWHGTQCSKPPDVTIAIYNYPEMISDCSVLYNLFCN